jgi:hypothetical protein
MERIVLRLHQSSRAAVDAPRHSPQDGGYTRDNPESPILDAFSIDHHEVAHAVQEFGEGVPS